MLAALAATASAFVAPSVQAPRLAPAKALVEEGAFVPDMERRNIMNLILVFGGALPAVGGCVEINQCVGCTDNSSLSHFSAMTRPSWLGRAARNRHRHAIEQASRRWRGGRRDDSARTRAS